MIAARERAKAVVKDLSGGVRGGDLGDANPAHETVDEIKRLRGQAVADSHSVTDKSGAEAMVAMALSTFGGLHAVINSAGILRDKMLHKMDDEDWRAVIDVHLNG